MYGFLEAGIEKPMARGPSGEVDADQQVVNKEMEKAASPSPTCVPRKFSHYKEHQ